MIKVFLAKLLSATLRMATPLIFGTLGELFAERAGILNLGIEGTMLLGSFVGFATTYHTGSLWLGVLAACLAGVLSGLLMAILTVWLGVNQHVSGLGITMLGTGLAYFALRVIFGNPSLPPQIQPFVQLDPLSNIPVIGQIFSPPHDLYRYFNDSRSMVGYLPHQLGMNIRAVGENPEAVDAAG